MREYPRSIPHDGQIDFTEVMELNVQSLLVYHCIIRAGIALIFYII
jgi:hypothetical protein